MKKSIFSYLLLSIILIVFISDKEKLHERPLRDNVIVKNNIFEITYSEILEQPKKVTYFSTNRPQIVNRDGMDFYTVNGIHTSDGMDYRSNQWDKGHLAPAASFSDSRDHLYETFSYVNCSLQQQELNRTEWKNLEEQERLWDDFEPLKIVVILEFLNRNILPTGATIPSAFHKHIYWIKSRKVECYYFPNEKPNRLWKLYFRRDCPILHH